MSGDRALLVSIDGVAPRFVTPAIMPNLAALARGGSSCFTARTVVPSVTLPAHLSMLSGIAPATHGVSTNTPEPPSGSQSTVLAVARRAGLRTAVVHTWKPLDAIFEKDATDRRIVVGDGYEPSDDDEVVDEAIALLRSGVDLVFAYLGAPDLVGHASEWGSPAYLEALTDSDRRLGRLLSASGSERHVVVTTDHGGTGNDHAAAEPTDLETFVVARSPRLAPGSGWAAASIVDIAPTVADLLGLDADPAWEGRSLVGSEEGLVDVVMALLAAGADVTYGERVSMLDHALQTAAVAADAGADDDLRLAALLHDIGHVLGDAGEWGLPSHAEVGARALQPLVDGAVVEPIRLHVDAKRWLVATDETYRSHLSEASVASLAEQGGPFPPRQAAEFASLPGSDRAVALRRWDDDGKVVGLTIPDLESHRSLVARAIAPLPDRSAAWYRDACRCAECRDAGNDQHLLDVTDLHGWRLEAAWRRGDELVADVVHDRHGAHRCVVPPPPPELDLRWWGVEMGERLVASAADHRGDWAAPTAEAVVRDGIALIRNVPTEPEAVLDVARRLGFVRETNYGELFDVIARPDPANLADTAVGLPLHTDNPYRDPCPTVQLLHCLETAGSGGASRFSDGIHGAERLRRVRPDLFDRLASTVVRFRYHGDGGDLRASRPLIDVSSDGTIRGVAVNHRSMEAPDLDAQAADDFYDAYRALVHLLSAADAVAELTLGPGDLVVFDNRRVLHGRTAFEVTGRRHLQGCYIDVDALQSQVRARV
ncbi:MAG: TauD/TfdA family dioxygenase [Actinomycetota bacterium]